MKLLVLLVLLGLVAAIDAVVGGSDAPDHKYPFAVSVRKSPTNMHVSTGTILNKRWILTVANYLTDGSGRPIHPSLITVQVGSNILQFDSKPSFKGLVYKVDNVTVHKQYDSLRALNNIALLRIDRELVFNEKVQPVVLPERNNFPVNTSAVITGWGAGWIGGSISETLKEVGVKLASQETCNAYWDREALQPIHISEMHICSWIEKGKGACQNDLGDPLLIDGVQVGILSFISGCGDGRPQGFTRVFHYLDWIKENAVVE